MYLILVYCFCINHIINIRIVLLSKLQNKLFHIKFNTRKIPLLLLLNNRI